MKRGARARGMTLVEVTLGLVLAGVVALMAYGAFAAATDTRERLALGQEEAREALAWRNLLADVVRSVRPAMDYDGPTLRVEAAPGGGTVLGVVTAVGVPPLAQGADWRVVFRATGDSVWAEATPVGGGGAPRRIPGPARYTGMHVEVLAPGAGWVEGWRNPARLPIALRVRFLAGEGQDGPDLLVALPSEVLR